MHVHHVLVTATAGTLLGVFGLAAPAAARVSAQPVAAGVLTMSAGRLGAFAACLLGLTGVVIGGLALARPAGRLGTRRRAAVVALAAGLLGTALGGLVVVTSDSGIGTGNGRGGAYVAVVLGLAATVLGGLAVTRSRRTGRLPA